MSKHDAVNHPKHYQLGNLNVEAPVMKQSH